MAWDSLGVPAVAVDTVITDVRFPNEAEAVRDHNGWVLKILRPGFDTGVGNDHPSEREVDACAFDYLVRNDRDVPELHAKVRRILDDVLYAATR